MQTYNEWRCRFVNSRDAHMERHGKRVLQGQTFPDSVMRYPGDPNGSAEEVINCHCYLQVGVLLHGETLDSDGNIVKADSLQNTEPVTKENASAKKQEQKVAESIDTQGIQNDSNLNNEAKSDIIEKGNFIIPVRKLTAYALDYSKDPDKAKAFESALGYTQENANDLIANIMEHVSEENLVERGDKGHGMRYECIVSLTGANGKTANVVTAWIRDKERLRLTSVYVTRRKATK